MNPIYKILASITFILTIPFIFVIGIYYIWISKKPAVFNYTQTANKSNSVSATIQ